ncbi:MAG: AraC family transcriptional regulator [Robiginitomaculum sp.]|nr:MAG: AraC family transcriptional regulator [Robiginitomaculum sp.]
MNSILEKWTHYSDNVSTAIVFPDGCYDVILAYHPKRKPHCFISDIDHMSYQVDLEAGVTLTGYRLQPGVISNKTSIIKHLNNTLENIADIEGIIEEHSTHSNAVHDAIQCLSGRIKSVSAAAAMLGVSQRTLQRSFQNWRIEPPEFWLLLARARRAACHVRSTTQLAEIAYLEGYADQAHMTREFQRWFQLTPGHLRQSNSAHENIIQSGLGTCNS